MVTYITPLLEHVSGLTPHEVTIALLLFGVGLTIGNLLGGRLADWRLQTTVIATFIAVILVLVGFTVTSRWAIPAVATLTLWGALAFALVSPLQSWSSKRRATRRTSLRLLIRVRSISATRQGPGPVASR